MAFFLERFTYTMLDEDFTYSCPCRRVMPQNRHERFGFQTPQLKSGGFQAAAQFSCMYFVCILLRRILKILHNSGYRNQCTIVYRGHARFLEGHLIESKMLKMPNGDLRTRTP